MLVKDYRVDDSPVHKAIREAFVNLIIHADYLVDAGTLKIIKTSNGFSFTNPGTLKLPKEEIYRGGNSKPRNPRMQTMLRMVGFGDNAGSGFPTILDVWEKAGWKQPELLEDTVLDQVTLELNIVSVADSLPESAEKSADNSAQGENKLSDRHKQILEKMSENVEYSTEEVASSIGLKGARTRQLLNELVEMGKVKSTAATKKRRYIKNNQ
jgi:predicted HTH transcriptional regulator